MHKKEVEPSSSGRSKIGVTSGVMTSQKSGSIRKLHTCEGASSACQDTNNGNARQSQRCELRRAVANDGAERFSHIDDHEVMKYIHSKKEMHYKRMIWEVMNRDYVKPKKQKQAKDVKKATPAKRAAKITSPVEEKKKLSSKINYDVLKNLFDEPEEVSHLAKGEGTQISSHGNKLSNEKANTKAHSEDKSEFEDGSEANEEVNESGNYYDDLYNGNEEDEEDENWDEYDREEY